MLDASFDFERACSQLQITKEIYLRIVQKAFDQTKQDLEKLDQAYESNDVSTVQAISHRLKGDYANLRVDRLSSIAMDLNNLVKQGYDRQQAGVLIEKIKTAFRQFEVAVSKET